MLKRQGNVFLTGAAGTGKSFLLAQYLRGKPSDAFPVVASTGAAAVLVGGRTFHSFFGLGIMEGGLEATIARALRSKKLVTRLQRAHCVVIDEISMLSGATLMAAEVVTRRARGNLHEPWGGLRIIAVGDFAQLPPVTRGTQQKDWAFLHQTWHDSAFVPALLSTVMRTQDTEFLRVLNQVRLGNVSEQVRQFLDERTNTHLEHTDLPRLYPHRDKAEAYNLQRLEDIPGEAQAIATQYEGDDKLVQAAKKSIPVPDTLLLKEGALVMLRKNDMSPEQLYVNGSLGHVRRIGQDNLTIKLLGGETVEVTKQVFSYLNGDGQVMAAALNFPVTLAWATTIHKAQGASLDGMIVDLSQLWEPGQAYVALSRVRSAERLYIERWSEQSIRAEPLVTAFYDTLAEDMRNYVPRPLFEPVVAQPSKDTAESDDSQEQPESQVRKERPQGALQRRRSAKIREMVADCAPLESIARTCGLRPERVLVYLEKFALTGEALNIGYMLEEVAEVDTIRAAFEQHGLDRLAPVYEALNEQIPYLTLRLVRCAMVGEES